MSILPGFTGADINAQTEETQETALTLACCGGFLDVADFLIKAGADIELGCSTPLMEAAQEGHLELVKYLLKARKYCNFSDKVTLGYMPHESFLIILEEKKNLVVECHIYGLGQPRK